jgi:hypothetical protein
MNFASLDSAQPASRRLQSKLLHEDNSLAKALGRKEREAEEMIP